MRGGTERRRAVATGDLHNEAGSSEGFPIRIATGRIAP
jgi:hypothetical protein